jgi:outer membrane lipoprotein-sorting protein
MISTKTFRSIFVLIFITVALFASGCAEKNLSAEEIATKMVEKQNSIQDYSYTMHMTTYFDGKVEESEAKTMFKKPNLFKSIDTVPGKENQTISVSDGQFMWSYTQDTNEVLKIALPNASEPSKNDYINTISEFLNDTNIKLLGADNVDGRNTYLLETIPEETGGIYELMYKSKIWVDQETWMPLKYETFNITGDPTMKLEIRDLEVNTGIPDSEFKFEVPSGAKVIDMGDIKPPEELSLEEARERASFNILTPTYLPEGYEFSNAMVYNNTGFYAESPAFETVALTYTKDKESINLAETVYQNQSSDRKDMDEGEDIKVNGIEGKYLSFGKLKFLSWKLGDVELSLSSSLEKGEMLKIAESISEKT